MKSKGRPLGFNETNYFYSFYHFYHLDVDWTTLYNYIERKTSRASNRGTTACLRRGVYDWSIAKTILVASWCVCKRNIHIVIHAIRKQNISCMLASWLSRVYAWIVCVYIHIIYNTTQASSGTFTACLISLALAVIMLLFRKHFSDKSGESGTSYKSCRFVTT